MMIKLLKEFYLSDINRCDYLPFGKKNLRHLGIKNKFFILSVPRFLRYIFITAFPEKLFGKSSS